MTENVKEDISEEIEKLEGDPLSIKDFNERLNTFGTPEEKLQEVISYMRACISTEKNPYFKGFWEGCKAALHLFKENIAPQVRVLFWRQYRDLCQEFRKLKQVLDEQSEFAVEQIHLAIDSLNKELESFDSLVQKQPKMDLSPLPKSLERNIDLYVTMQEELDLLNAFASRINSLRKELIKTEMRIRIKNKFFKELSELGDKIFPRRKELIKTLSQTFTEDVADFVRLYFEEKREKAPLFFLREEIKSLQNIAKYLTLNTHAFNETRTKLSACWDIIRSFEKEKKKEFQEKKSLYKQNIDLALAKIEEEKSTFTPANVHEKIDLLFDFLQPLDLGRDERKYLKDAIYQAAGPILDEIKKQEEERIQKEAEAQKMRRERVLQFQEKLKALLGNVEVLSIEEAEAEKERLSSQLHTLPCTKMEKVQLEKLVKPIRDLINEKKEKVVLQLSQDDLSALDQLKGILQQRKERRKEIKALLEELRKTSGGSTLNFEKALQIKERIAEEKGRLEKIGEGIFEIEEQIKKLAH